MTIRVANKSNKDALIHMLDTGIPAHFRATYGGYEFDVDDEDSEDFIDALEVGGFQFDVETESGSGAPSLERFTPKLPKTTFGKDKGMDIKMPKMSFTSRKNKRSARKGKYGDD